MNNKYYLYIILTTLLSISCQKFGHHLALETGTLTNKTASGAQADAMVIDVGESGLTEHGWCIATEPAPTVSNTKINNGSKSQYGIFNNEITGLDPASKYYIRPYITNGSQTVYGEQLELQTEALQFTINTPVANAIWAKGKTFSINWVANINDKINIDLYEGTTLEKNIAQGIENTGSYNWPINNEIENGEDYKIIITSSENEIIKAETTLFSIYDNAPPGVSTEEASNISYFTAQISGTLVHFGTEEAVIQHGHCWSKNENPTIDDNKTELGARSTLGNYTSDLSELEDNTMYYVRAYAVSEEGVAYGEQNSFTTLDAIPPTVITSEVTNISYTSATCGGEVADDGTHDVISRGVCWGISENPTVDDDKVEVGSGIGIYFTDIDNLENNTTYYMRAFAINVADTSYGEHVVCSTFEATLPTVITSAITNLSYTSANCEVVIISDGGEPIIEKGVCWNTIGNPNINENKKNEGTGNDNITSNLTGLEFNTTYFVRAYAINDIGLSYGEEKTFTTEERTGTFIDNRDDNVYDWVRIGNQTWMAENLAYLPRVYGPYDGGMGDNDHSFYVYDYDGENVEEAKKTSNYQIYGVLYTWMTAMTNENSSSSNPSGVQGICPEGWHLPSEEEWLELIDFVANNNNAGSAKLALCANYSWNEFNGTDEFGFSMLAAGRMNFDSVFHGMGSLANYWSSTLFDEFGLGLWGDSMNTNNIGDGLSVRCIKD